MSDAQHMTEEAAFPRMAGHDSGEISSPEYGLTKREYFAAAALSGILASTEYSMTNHDAALPFIVSRAAYAADLLIESLAKSPLPTQP